MTNQEAKDFTVRAFESIKQAKTTSELQDIPQNLDLPSKFRMNIDVYPKIGYRITSEDIKLLMDDNKIGKDHSFSNHIVTESSDPLTKLLYAVCWKNGDLKKVKHIIKGVLDKNQTKDDQEAALVFYQFGKYLTKEQGQPIIDQHVIRAFAIYRSENDDEIGKLRKLGVINKSHKNFIMKYIEWLKSDAIHQNLKKEEDYTYYIDQILFAVGKYIKVRK